MAMISCPTDDLLRRLGFESLDPLVFASLDDHIEECLECRQRIELLAKDNIWDDPTLTCRPAERDAPRGIPGFVVEREIGRGATSVVYLARDQRLGRKVALKVMPDSPRAGLRARKRWLKEAQAYSRVRHANVVSLFEVGEAGSWLYLVLEWVAGGTLRKRLEGPVPARVAAALMAKVADAVEHIHLAGQLHLDLKPSNILVDAEMAAPLDQVTPKVADFGIARLKVGAVADGFEAETTLSGAWGGTPAYMAPEQISGTRAQLGPGADIYALGAILYELLTGRPPFQGESPIETLVQVRDLDAVPPRRLNPRISRSLETVTLKCLAKGASQRYLSAAALAADLRRFIEGRPISARPGTLAERMLRWCQRQPVVAALSAALLLTVFVSFVVVTLLWRQAEANFRMSKEVLAELVDLSIGGSSGFPSAITVDRLIPHLEHVGQHLLVLSKSQPDDLQMALSVALIEFRLAQRLQHARRSEDALAKLLESKASLEVFLRRDPLNEDLGDMQMLQFRLLAEVSERLGKSDESIDYLVRAVRSAEDEVRRATRADRFWRLISARRALAWHLFSRGEHDETRKLIAANDGLVKHLASECESPLAECERILADIDMKLINEFSPSETDLAATACEVSVNGPLSSLASPTDASQKPAEWAKIAAEFLRVAKHSGSAATARLDSDDESRVVGHLRALAAMLNRVGKLDGARRIAERMLALGEFSVANHPVEPAAHLSLYLAYVQLYKNACRVDDRPAVAANMKLGLAAAQKALALDHGSELAQHAVYDLERRFADLIAKR